jgi:hypothetical protein
VADVPPAPDVEVLLLDELPPPLPPGLPDVESEPQAPSAPITIAADENRTKDTRVMTVISSRHPLAHRSRRRMLSTNRHVRFDDDCK